MYYILFYNVHLMPSRILKFFNEDVSAITFVVYETSFQHHAANNASSKLFCCALFVTIICDILFPNKINSKISVFVN